MPEGEEAERRELTAGSLLPSRDRQPPAADPDRDAPPLAEGAPATARIDRYALLDQLGGGGMGVVYAAYDQHLDRKVALKVLSERNTSAAAQARMLREAQALARLNHPNVVSVHDVGVADGRVFMAMEFVSGQTLREWLREAPRSPQAILGVFIEAGRGLAAAHAAGIVHRDFKPDNVMVAEDGGVRVFDFGLARPTGATTDQELDFAAAAAHEALGDLGEVTATGTILGTPGYMSPEQHMGRSADARSDIYAFCVSLYEAFFAERPFTGETHSELANAVIRGELRAIPRGIVSPRLLRIILRGLDVDPEARWPSMEALLAALTDDPTRRRWRRLAILAVALLTAGIVLATPSLFTDLYGRWQEDRRQRAAAARWDQTAAAIARLEAQGQTDAGDRLFLAFTSDPEHHETRALARAWLGRAAAAAAEGDDTAAATAFAEAYLAATDDTLAAEALLALAQRAHRRRDWPVLGELARELARGPLAGSAAVRDLRLDAALATRDRASARDLLAAQGHAMSPAKRAVAGLTVALSRGRRLDVRLVEGSEFDIDGDGVEELILLGPDRRTVTVIDRDLRLLLRHEFPAGHGQGRLVAGRPEVWTHREGHLYLHRIGDRVDLRWRLPAPTAVYSSAAGDLDGDGQGERYVGLAAYRRGLHVLREPQGPGDLTAPTLEIADLATDRSRSDINDLLIADLDGDGRDELIAALGPWRAYDLRVFADRGAGLELIDRVDLGNVSAVATLRSRGGERLLAALKDDRWPDRRTFPAAPHTGVKAGLYLFALEGGRLVPRGTLDPLAPFPGAEHDYPGKLFAGDLDGDGVDELVFNVKTAETALGRLLIVVHQGETREEGLVAARIAGLEVLAAAELDGDPARELLVRDYTELQGYWALGVGDEALAPITPPRLDPPPRDLVSPRSRGLWERAERLAALGLHGIAAEGLALAALVHTSGGKSGNCQGDEECAALSTRSSKIARSIGVSGPLEASPANLAIVGGRYAEALEWADDASPELVLADRLHRRELLVLADPALQDRLEFSTGLDPRWELLEPLGLRRDPLAEHLVIDAYQRRAPLARLPLRWDGGPLALRIALTTLRSEFAGSLEVTIRGGDGARVASLWISTRGGGGIYSHQIGCLTEGQAVGDGSISATPLQTLDQRFDDHLTLTVIPSRGIAGCRRGDDLRPAHGFALTDDLPPGPYTLELIGGARSDSDGALLTVALRRLELAGATLGAPPPGPLGPAYHLVDGDDAAALAALEGGSDPLRALWWALAAARRGELPEARRALRRSLASDPRGVGERTDLGILARVHPELEAPLREVLGEAYTPLAAAAWRGVLYHHPDDPGLARRVLRSFAYLDVAAPTTGGERSGARSGDRSGDRSGARAHAASEALLLAARGRAWAAVGELDRALADLRAAEAMLWPEGDAMDEVVGVAEEVAVEVAAEDAARARRDEGVAIALSLAEVHAALGDHAAARAAIARGLARSPTPALDRARIRRDPRLGNLIPGHL